MKYLVEMFVQFCSRFGMIMNKYILSQLKSISTDPMICSMFIDMSG